MWFKTSLLLFACVVGSAAADDWKDLASPVKVLVGGQALDVQRSGHSAPFMGDFDGDGLPDLLVGQFEDGKLRIYRNNGTSTQPRFQDYNWFRAGDYFGRVPVG